MFEGHGDDLYRYGDKIKYNFSTNIVASANHTELFAHLSKKLPIISSYPEPTPFSLENKISEKLGIEAENIVVTNGASDAIYRLAEINRGASSAILVPTFREYQDAAARFGHRISFISELTEENLINQDIVWLCNPENPTGRIYDKTEILGFSRTFPETLWIIDQAYADYTSEPVLTSTEAVASGNIILLSSLTKRYCVPGLRIGYITGNSRILSDVRSAGIPWSVNSLAIEAGHFLIDHDELYVIDAAFLNSEADRIRQAFIEVGIEVGPTSCNFILCRLPRHYSAARLKAFLVDKYGILIRDASNFETLDERYFRIAAQDIQANNMLIAAVKDFIV